MRIPIGILSDRLEMRKIFICGGVLVSILSSLILYLANDPVLILAARGLAGVSASVWVVFTVLFSSCFEKGKTASRISFLNMYNNLG